MTQKPFDLHQHLAAQRQIAIVWSVADVRDVRPDLTDDQCWDVLQTAANQHDALVGLSWDTLRCVADDLFGVQPFAERTE
jgi:hypothetical protein